MDPKITSKVAALELLTIEELKPLWRKYFDNDPVRFQRDYMVRRIAYQIQAKAYGGLPKTIRNKLKRLAEEGQATVREQIQVIPGTRLMREYKGERIHVAVLDDGFEFKGQRYKSLTAIATELMGSRTSGPKFFGLLRGGDEQ
jgi:hypothetical protein